MGRLKNGPYGWASGLTVLVFALLAGVAEAQTGACCLEFFCQEGQTAGDCSSSGGVYIGDGSTCGDCPGACCLGDDSCIPSTRGDCQRMENASFGGNFTECPPMGCGDGACCFATTDPDGFCIGPINPLDCAFSGGEHLGPGTDCKDSPCEPFGGACCLNFGGCVIVTQEVCEEEFTNATFIGKGISCGIPTNTCPGSGACCVSDTCVEADALNCVKMRGNYQGEGTSCSLEACADDECTTDAQCDNGLFCDGPERCVAGSCEPGVPFICDDNDPCTDDFCNEGIDSCDATPRECPDDGNSCTQQQCNPTSGACESTPIADCGACCFTSAMGSGCFDGFTSEQCAPLGFSSFRLGNTCDEVNDCLGACCLPGGDCETSTPEGFCISLIGLNGAYRGDDTPCCSDGDACNGFEQCDLNGNCQPGTPPDCDDGVACTVDDCDPLVGCFNSPDDALCADENACTFNERCDPENGCVFDTLSCDDFNDCTVDSCDPVLGCVNTPIDCDDGIDCTVDTCNPDTGECEHAPNDDLCIDEDACTLNERCDVDQGCVFMLESCDDGIDCTVDICLSPGGECSNAPLDERCDDNIACTVDTCDPNMGCLNGAEDSLCDDGIDCTIDNCRPTDPNADADGCLRTPDNIVCADADLCIDNICDPEIGCVDTIVECPEDGDPCTEEICNSATGFCNSFDVCGACCRLFSGCVNNVTAEQCVLAPEADTFLGVGSTCETSECGACCVDGPLHCEDGTLREECESVGTFGGPGSACGDNVCTGACCRLFSGCVDNLTAEQCALAPEADTFLGVGSTCDTSECGACCTGGSLGCEDGTMRDECEAVGTFAGPGSACSDNACMGACCVLGVGCEDGTTADDCNSLDEVFMGAGSECASAPCGACCAANSSSCIDGALQNECMFDGVFQGSNSQCASSDCHGACCLNADNCVIIEGENCPGDFRGTGTNCAELEPPCADFAGGACCRDDGTCADGVSRDTCIFINDGDYQGDFSLCKFTDCTATGACCFEDDNCINLTEAGCTERAAATGLDAVFLGKGTECTLIIDLNQTCPEIGACCLGDLLDCIELTDIECLQSGGVFLGLGQPCVAEICECEGGCDDGIACTFDDCNPATQTCINVPSDALCDDSIDCTIDECDPTVGCFNLPDDVACDDGDPCTIDTCDTSTGCMNTPIVCDDGIACTVDICDANGQCQFAPSSTLCDDSVGCTSDICDPDNGCINSPSNAACEDGNVCTIDTCDPVADCQQANVVCPSDGNPCTDDVCLPNQGCVNQPNFDPCNDGQICTANDTCNMGMCVGGLPLDCDDNDACTNDQCQPGVGCISTFACIDGDVCTQDICISPAIGCLNPPVICPDDGDLCTVEVCDAGSGGCIVAPRECPNDQRCETSTGMCVCPEVCGDLDFDDDVDEDDYELFLFTFGSSSGEPRFNICADYDEDGAVTLVDFQQWRLCFFAFVGLP